MQTHKSVKSQSSFHFHFVLLGSTRVKAVCKMSMKLTPGDDFILLFITITSYIKALLYQDRLTS